MLRIAGITPFSTVDWPGKLSCVAFLAGCPWACAYCQNHELRQKESATQSEAELFLFLEQRRGLLDAVVFSGGEPLSQAGITDAARRARSMGFEVGLHTCGAFPQRLEEVLPYVDWVGLDVKAPWDDYGSVTGVRGSGEPARQSLRLILDSGVGLETRTTWHPDLLSQDQIAAIARDLAAQGVRTWAVQAYRHVGTTGELSNETVYPSDVPLDLPPLFEHYEFRRA